MKKLTKIILQFKLLRQLKDADLVFFVTDYSSGILPHDFELSSILRKTKKR